MSFIDWLNRFFQSVCLEWLRSIAYGLFIANCYENVDVLHTECEFLKQAKIIHTITVSTLSMYFFCKFSKPFRVGKRMCINPVTSIVKISVG